MPARPSRRGSKPRRLVQDEYARISHECPRDAEPLLLAAAQTEASFAYHSIVAVLPGNDAVLELGAFRRLHDALAVVALEAVADVKRDTLVKEYSLLGDDGRQPAQRRLLDSSDIYAADAYTAARDVVEAARQPRRRALA